MQKNKGGQLTIWIILGVILVATIILFFVLKSKPKIVKPGEGDVVFDVQTYLESCTKEYVLEASNIMLPQGGFINPRNSILFNSTNIAYLCENVGFYEPCIQQHPMLLNEMKKEIINYAHPKIETCLQDMKKEVEKKGGTVGFESSTPSTINVEFGQDKITLNIKKPLVVSKQEEIRKFDNFKIDVQSPVYNLASVAMEIASQEARFCYFEYVGYKIIYPRYTIKKYELSRLSKVYTITDTRSGKTMNIAIRSCAIPAGF